jgi:hypothetical protein
MMPEKPKPKSLILPGMALLGLLIARPAPLHAADASNVAANFTIYVGGLLFVEGNFNARVADDDYRLATSMATAGIAARFYPATYKLMSEGRLEADQVEPRRFVSDTKAKKDARLVTMTYGKDRMPRLTATPPYDPDDLKEVTAAQKQATLDPVSAFLLPVTNTENPCARTLPVFDGRRRYNLTFAYQGEKEITPHDSARPENRGEPRLTVVCTIRYEAIAPIEKKRKFTTMLRRNDDMRIWLAPFNNGRVYMPVRFELRTPIGMAVMELQDLTERKAAASISEKTRFAKK